MTRAIALEPHTPLTTIFRNLPKETVRELSQELKTVGYVDFVDSGTGLLFIFLFPLFAVLLGLGMNLTGSMCLMPLSLGLSGLVTAMVSIALSPIILVPAPPYGTLADLTCLGVLRESAKTSSWTKSDLCLLARFVTADAYGKSVRDVRLHSKFHEL
jgi:hypothetical protein